MKILLITAYYKEEARSIPTSYKLARLFAEHGDKVVVLASKAISKRTDEPHRNIKVYETRDFYIPDPLNVNIMPNLFGALSKVIKKEKPDICIVSKYIWFPIISTPFLKLKKLPVIVVIDTYPGVVWFVRNKLVNFMTWVYYHTVGRFFLKFTDLVILTHEEIIEATKGIGVKNYRVIHNGIDLRKVDAARPSSAVKKKSGEIVITFVGRLASIKGLDTLLAAAEKIVARHNNVRFLLVGGGDSTKLKKHRQIEYLGYSNDVVGILKKSDIMVMPSISEGLPAAVIEGMACAVPVVGSNIPGGMNILVRHNKTGLRFKVGNAADLEKQLERLISSKNLRARLGANARKLIEDEFNNEQVYKEWRSAIHDVWGHAK